MKVELPKVLANQAQNFFVSSWDKQGWDGAAWKVPQRRIEGTKAYKYPKKYKLSRRTNITLVGAGNKKGAGGGTLRRAVSNSIRSQTFNQVRLVVDLPYAKIHNDGLPMKNGVNMPKRTFMKDSPILRVSQQVKIKEFGDKVWGFKI